MLTSFSLPGSADAQLLPPLTVLLVRLSISLLPCFSFSPIPLAQSCTSLLHQILHINSWTTCSA